jgi:hypothetical protein
MLQRDPLRQNVHMHIWLMVLYTFFIAFLMLTVASQLLSLYFSAPFDLYMVAIHAILLLLLFLSLAFSWGWFWSMCMISRRRRQKRLRALQGDQDLLFSAQPSRDEHALGLPITIEVKMRMTIFFILIVGLVVIYLSLSFIAFYMQKLSFEDVRLLIFTNGCMLLISLLFVLLVARIAARYAHQQITVTEQGITTRFRRKTMSLAWNDARFFSLHGSTRSGMVGAGVEPPPGKPAAGFNPAPTIPDQSKHPFLYELSSMKESVVWMQLRANSFWLKPLIPFEHYQQQMNALAEMVAAKTDLPLYDLRDHAL